MKSEAIPTKEQLQIIESNANRICVFACAGSGKTFTITHRISYLINHRGEEPKSIAAITFTNLAADSLKKRGKYNFAIITVHKKDMLKKWIKRISGVLKKRMSVNLRNYYSPKKRKKMNFRNKWSP